MSALDALKSLKIPASSVFPRTPSAPKTQVLSNAGLLHSGNHDSKETGLPLAKPCFTPPIAKGSLLSQLSHSRNEQAQPVCPCAWPHPLSWWRGQGLPAFLIYRSDRVAERNCSMPTPRAIPHLLSQGMGPHTQPLSVLCVGRAFWAPRENNRCRDLKTN